MATIKGESMNGEQTYELSDGPGLVPLGSAHEATEALAAAAREYVRNEYGITPAGVAWLLDRRTVQYEA